MTERGKFIVIYGPNNLGKSTQAPALVQQLIASGIDAVYIKYPIYELEPTGLRIDRIVRKGLENLDPESLQEVYAQNRRDFQPTLEGVLDRGTWVIAEDYKGTGLAWGVTFGVSLERMIEINAGLLDEDLAICLDGEKFGSGIERKHLFEQSGLWERSRQVHRELAKRYGWEIINANQLEGKVAEDVWEIVRKKFIFRGDYRDVLPTGNRYDR